MPSIDRSTSYCHIGLMKINSQWIWSDDTTYNADNTPWYPNYPLHDCGVIQGYGGLILTTRCTSNYRGICQTQAAG